MFRYFCASTWLLSGQCVRQRWFLNMSGPAAGIRKLGQSCPLRKTSRSRWIFSAAARLTSDNMTDALNEDSFDVFPVCDHYRGASQSPTSHALYENVDPLNLKESWGTLIIRNWNHEVISDRAVSVFESHFKRVSGDTIRTEGASRLIDRSSRRNSRIGRHGVFRLAACAIRQ